MAEKRPRPKLPRSVIILNIVMIVLILLICGLTFSLAFSAIKKETPATSAPTSHDTVSEALNASGVSQGETETEEDKPHTPPVPMTKRTTEPTEIIFVPSVESDPEPSGDDIFEPPTEDAPSTSYSKEFFADDLFIGDSISTGLYLYGKLEMKNVVASIGYTPYKAYSEAVDLYDGTSMTALEYAQSMQPKRIFIMLGSNGMGSSVDVEVIKTSYGTLLEKLSAACPDSEIYCISVPPVTADSSSAASSGISNELINDFNSSLKGICEGMGIGYLDLHALLTDNSGFFKEEYAEVDGLHFLGTTYDVMLSFIQSEVGG